MKLALPVAVAFGGFIIYKLGQRHDGREHGRRKGIIDFQAVLQKVSFCRLQLASQFLAYNPSTVNLPTMQPSAADVGRSLRQVAQ